MKKVGKILSVAAVTATALITLTVVALCAFFPNKYSREINDAAEAFELDPVLVRSVIWAESRFDAKAVSSAGAVGLMQLMPETFSECAAALGMKKADAFDVRSSLLCGCYYLSALMDKFGDTTAALYAYNAGEANARRFLDGEPIFPETRAYVAAVNRAMRYYGFFMPNSVRNKSTVSASNFSLSLSDGTQKSASVAR